MNKNKEITRPEVADAVLRFCQLLPRTSDGKPMQLIGWQKESLTDFFSHWRYDEAGDLVRVRRYLYWELTKKQGKTELAAELAIWFLLDPMELNGEVYLLAADRDNAGICYDAVVFKIRNTPYLQKLEARGELEVRESTRTVRYRKTFSKLRVLSADAKTKHGYKPSAVIFDELHAQPNRNLWDVMTFGAGDARKSPAWIVLTTAGDDPDRRSIGWEVHRKAVAIRDARIVKKTRPEDYSKLPFLSGEDDAALASAAALAAAQDDEQWTVALYGLSAMYSDDEDRIAAADIYDEALWRACNPSIGVTVPLATIRREAQEARRSDAAERLFRWLRLNQWIATKSVGWIPLPIYDKTQWKFGLEVLLGKKCYAGLDLSATTDMTGYGLYFPAQPGLPCEVFLAYGWIPSDEIELREKRDYAPYRDWARAGFLELCAGNVIDYEAVIERILEDAKRYRLVALGTDPFLSRTITQRLQAGGVSCFEIPQTISGMWPAMWDMETKIRAHTLLHVHNTALRYCFGNVRCAMDGNGNLKPMKNRSRGRIDMLVAFINAAACRLLDEQRERDLAEAIGAGGFTL